MKITFSPIIKNHQTYLNKTSKLNVADNIQQQTNTNSLECLSNYNLSFASRRPRPIYIINYDGSYKKVESISKVTTEAQTAIGAVLSGRCAILNNKTYVYAEEIEGQNGEVDTKEVYNAILRFQNALNQPIYAIDYSGNIQRFDNRKQASEELDIALSDINKCLNEKTNAASGYVFTRAFDVELRNKNGEILKDENNQPILYTEAINKLREGFLYIGKRFPVVSIDKDGNVIQYKNIKEVSTKTNTKRININQSIIKQSITQGKYTYARLSDVVLFDEFGVVVYDENNNFAIDRKKVEQIRRFVFPK